MYDKIKNWLKERKKVIKMTTVEAIKNENATLVDVREPFELETEGVVEGAINIPMGDVPARLEEFRNFSEPIVVFCRSGNRSGKIAQFLQENGIEDIYNGGGFADVQEVLNS